MRVMMMLVAMAYLLGACAHKTDLRMPSKEAPKEKPAVTGGTI